MASKKPSLELCNRCGHAAYLHGGVYGCHEHEGLDDCDCEGFIEPPKEEWKSLVKAVKRHAKAPRQ